MDKSKNYYVYCRAGSRSSQACQIMDQMGLRIPDLTGGYSNWDGCFSKELSEDPFYFPIKGVQLKNIHNSNTC
jgi:hypothetical protein